MSHRLPGGGREKSNRAAMTDWGSTFRLMLLRAVSGATVIVVVGYITDLLDGALPG